MSNRIIFRPAVSVSKRRTNIAAIIASGIAITLAAATATSGVGTFGPNVTDNVTLSAATANAAAGTITPGTGNVFLQSATATAAAGSLTIGSATIAEFSAGKIFQRNKGTNTSWNDGTASITFTGTYTGMGAPSGATITINGIPYTATSFTASGGNWSGIVATVPNGDGYTASVQVTGGATATQSNSWGVGILIACIGQSNMANMFAAYGSSPLPPPPTTNAHVRFTFGSNTWVSTAYDGASTWGNQMRAFMHALDNANTTPVGFIAGAVGSTSITTWQSGGGASWTSFAATAAASGGDFELVYWHQGENDTLTGGTNPAVLGGVGYQVLLQNVVTQCQTLTGRNSSQIKFGVAQLGNYSQASGGTDPAFLSLVQTYDLNVAAQTGCFLAGTLADVIHVYGAGAHYGDAGQHLATYPRFAYRFAISACNQLGLSNVSYGASGPTITQAIWPVGSTSLIVNVTQNSGGTALQLGSGATSGSLNLGGGYTPWVVTSSGGQTISSGSFSGNTITLAMSGARGGGDTVTLYYAAGVDPFNYGDTPYPTTWVNVLFDNQQAYLGDPGDAGYPTQYGGPSGFPLQLTSGGAASPMTVGSGTPLNAATATAGVGTFSTTTADSVILSGAAATASVAAFSSINLSVNVSLQPAVATANAGFWANSNFPYNQGVANLLLLGVG